VAAPALLLPSLAFAHPGGLAAHGFGHGFLHPLTGLDHLLAMIAVGVWASMLGGRALWAVPSAFVAMMMVGGALGIGGIGLPAVEVMIALSLVALGAVVAFELKVQTVVGMVLVGAFALFHGHAHGSEIPGAANGLTYALGFTLATAMLHLAGLGIGLGAGRIAGRAALRVAGTAMAATGLLMVVGAI
jgi:urease accessory protein